MRPRKSSQSRTSILAIRIPPYLRERIENEADAYGLSITDAAILALQRGYGDQRGIILSRAQREGRFVRNRDGSRTLVAPHRPQVPARSEPNNPLPDPWATPPSTESVGEET